MMCARVYVCVSMSVFVCVCEYTHILYMHVHTSMCVLHICMNMCSQQQVTIKCEPVRVCYRGVQGIKAVQSKRLLDHHHLKHLRPSSDRSGGLPRALADRPDQRQKDLQEKHDGAENKAPREEEDGTLKVQEGERLKGASAGSLLLNFYLLCLLLATPFEVPLLLLVQRDLAPALDQAKLSREMLGVGLRGICIQGLYKTFYLYLHSSLI